MPKYGTTTSGQRVLILDESAPTRSSLTELLEEAGHECRSTGTPSVALDLVGVFLPTIFVYDWASLSDAYDGIAKRIRRRASSLNLKIRVIAHSLQAPPSDFIRAEQVDHFLTKPMLLDEFHRAVVELTN